MTVGHPGEQRLGFADVARIEARIERMQVVCRLARGGLHLRPVGTGDPHVAHAVLDLLLSERSVRGSTNRSTSMCWKDSRRCLRRRRRVHVPPAPEDCRRRRGSRRKWDARGKCMVSDAA